MNILAKSDEKSFDPQRAYQRVNLHMSRIKKGWTFADNRYGLVKTDRVTVSRFSKSCQFSLFLSMSQIEN